MNKTKVLFFLQSACGGAERMTVTIAKMFDVTRYDVVLIIITHKNTARTIEAFVPQGYRRKYIAYNSGMKLLINLFNCVREEKPDIVFSSAMHINSKLLATSWMFPKTRYIVRNDNYLYTLSYLQKLQLKYTYTFADKVVVQTDEMYKELINMGWVKEEKVVTLHNPIDKIFIDSKASEPSPYMDNNKKKYVASGRFDYVKGFDILVRAFKVVSETQSNSELYIIGDYDYNDRRQAYHNEISTLIKELQLTDKVLCVGFQDNPYKYVKNADVFVLSSRNEGLPNVLIEALYLGTPVAATTCIPVISRIVEEGKTGFLSDVENPISLAEAMLKASRLGRVISTYQPTSKDAFMSLL